MRKIRTQPTKIPEEIVDGVKDALIDFAPSPKLVEKFGEQTATAINIATKSFTIYHQIEQIDLEDEPEAYALGHAALENAPAVLEYLGGWEGALEKMGYQASCRLFQLIAQQEG